MTLHLLETPDCRAWPRSGYRLYSEQDIVKLDLVRTLRDAGLGLDVIRAVLVRDITLADALRLRLGAVEAHIASLRHIAAALRASLRSEPTEQDIRRLCAVTRLSNEERKAAIERFYGKIAEGIPIDKQWMWSMIEASSSKLPDDPSTAQLDAWVELQVVEVAEDARRRGVLPESDEAKTIVETYLAGLARCRGVTRPTPNFAPRCAIASSGRTLARRAIGSSSRSSTVSTRCPAASKNGDGSWRRRCTT